MKDIKIGKYSIGPNNPPFIIAELSANHNGSVEKALELIDKAKGAGVHAIKLQTYTPDTITLDINKGEFLITDPTSPWKGRSLYDLYKEAYTPWDWHDQLFKRCMEWGLIGFSTPFDESAVDFLEEFEVPCYKIASLEIVDIPLIKYVASKGKPIFMSTGGATEQEISEAVAAAKGAGCPDIILMKCTLDYPAKAEDMNLRTIPDMAKKFDTLMGLSDHTIGTGVAIASVALGACAIEKHLTAVRGREGGVDSAFSSEPAEFKMLVDESKKAWQALGSIKYGPLPVESSSYSHRPSIYFVEDIPAGTVIGPKHVRTIRPANGLPPKEMDRVLGSTLKQSVKKGTPVSWNFFNSK